MEEHRRRPMCKAIVHAVIQKGYRVVYFEAHALLDHLAEASVDGTRRERMTELATVPLLLIDDLGMRKLAATVAEDLASQLETGVEQLTGRKPRRFEEFARDYEASWQAR